MCVYTVHVWSETPFNVTYVHVLHHVTKNKILHSYEQTLTNFAEIM